MQKLCFVMHKSDLGEFNTVKTMVVDTDDDIKACEAAYVATSAITKEWADTGMRSTRKGDRIVVNNTPYDVLSVGFARAVEDQNDGIF